jgi:hypothetical protein
LDLADTAANLKRYGRPKASRGQTAFPQLRFVGLAEAGTHTLFGVAMGPYRRGELTLAKRLLAHLQPGMLCLADRLYAAFPLWKRAQRTGAELLWRARQNMVLPVEQLLEDGSFLSTLYPSTKARRHRRRGLRVRVIEYQLDGGGAEAGQTVYRLLTSLLDPQRAPAEQLARLYAQRWEIEGLFDELKPHLRGGQVVLRSKTPELVEQEFYGLLLAHWTVRWLDPGGRPARWAGPGPALLQSRGARGTPEAGHRARPFPLGLSPSIGRPFWPSCGRIAAFAVAAEWSRAVENAR